MVGEPVNANVFQVLAREALPKMYYDFYAGGAEDQYTLKDNVEAFHRIIKTAHQVDSPPTTGVLHESREPSPCTSHNTTIPTSIDLPGIGATLGRPQTGAIFDQLLCLAGLPSPSSTDCSPLISQQHQLAPSVGNAFQLSPHLYERIAWSGRDQWKLMHSCSLPVVNLQKWLQWRSKCETSQPTSKSSPGKTRPSTKNSNSMKLKRRSKGTKGRVRREATPSLDKSNNRSNNRSNNKSNNKNTAKNRKDETKGENTRMPYEESTAKWEQEIKAMKAQLGEMKDEFKGRATRNLDTLVHRTDSPFTEKVISFPLPSKFRMPSLENFDGTKDPLDHLESFKTMMCLQGVPDEIMCRAFPTTLKGPARIWFKKLIPGSVGSFAQLSRSFFNHFSGGQRCGRPTTHLLNVKQREGETLRSYLTRFNKETLLVDGADDKVIEELIKQGKLQRFVERDQREGRPPQARPQRPSVEDRPRPPMGEIHMINGGMAAGGTSRSSRKAYARQIHNVLVTQKANKTPRLEDLPITFTKEDARKVVHPHDDALVVILEIAGYSTRRVLIDNGSSADIIYLTAFQQMRIGKDQLRPIETPLPAPTQNKQRKGLSSFVVDCPSAYNVIIGRPTLNRLRAVTSTYHLLVRFPTEHGIGEMKGDQAMARECYLTSRQVFAPERNAAVMAEVDKLLTAGLHKRDLNKACPKDSYPLPRIDQLVDSTAGHKLLSFMDAFSGYNQIQMEEEDQEKTAFITSRGRNVEVYVDDMLVKSKENEDHLTDLKETFQALRTYNMKLNPKKCAFGVSSGKFLGFMVSQCGIEANPDKIKAILEMSPPTTVKEVQSLTGKAAALNRFVSRSTDKCLPFFKILRKAFQWTEECQRAFEELKLALSSSAVSSALIRKEERIQKPVYYTSRALKGAEEKAHSIVVLTDYPLRKAMNKPDAAGRLIQWSIEMNEFDIGYWPRTAIKAQALTDFIAEFTHPWEEEGEPEQLEIWTVNIDGSSTKEMGGAGIILVSPEKDKFEYAIQLRFRTTNNEAEYEAFLAGLKLSKKMGVKNLTVKSDSQLTLLPHFEKVDFAQIPREENVDADRLARLASSGEEFNGFLEIQGRPSTEEGTVNSIEDNVSWMSPIVRYLKEGKLPTDKMEARKLRIRASHFQLLDGILYKMGFSRPHLRCLSPEEANYVIREVHEGICRNHSGARALAHKLTRAGYYWPSLLHDATQYVKTCDKCQRFANIARAPPEEITPMTSPWPFAQWGLDIMGPFPVGTKQAKFLVVAIDYFTKWVEAEPLATISEKNVKNFVWKGVICRFGIPRVLVSNNGRQFDNGPFRELCGQLNIKNHYSSPRHPQANGQVEVTNRTLLKQIKTRLEGAKGMWVEELPSILWAYRTTIRTPTRETPFKLTNGTEAVIPVEIGLTTLKTTFHKEEENEG
uniref:Integrase catalytic domain-containing protein n=1 Tax=Fagus sylvatica TaxID=28930 RepID=A0A2N9J3I5_FAGSY